VSYRAQLVIGTIIAILLFLVLPALGDAAANFYMDQTCMPDNSVTLAFSWDGGASGMRQQWVDVSATDTWAVGSFTGAGPFAEGVQAYNWPGYKSGTSFYVRFNQQTSSGSWDATRTYRFTVKGCGAAASNAPAASGTPNANTQAVTPGQGSASSKDPKAFLGSYNPGLDFCDYAKCVENFWMGGGTLVMCKDGYYSLSGGKPGSCSSHGGNS
jgi:hypothetical protein